jgi:hypothetical protein
LAPANRTILFIADSTHCLAFIKPLATSDVSQIVKPGF